LLAAGPFGDHDTDISTVEENDEGCDDRRNLADFAPDKTRIEADPLGRTGQKVDGQDVAAERQPAHHGGARERLPESTGNVLQTGQEVVFGPRRIIVRGRLAMPIVNVENGIFEVSCVHGKPYLPPHQNS
jgi:hypothetical protein